MSSLNKKYIAGGILILICIVVIIVAIYFAKKSEKFTNNVNLTPESNEYIVALFYTDWCPHCQTFKPEFKKTMNELNNNKNKDGKLLRFVMVNCEEHKNLGKQYDVQGYPTVKFISTNNVSEYDGPRTYKGLKNSLV